MEWREGWKRAKMQIGRKVGMQAFAPELIENVQRDAQNMFENMT